MSAGAVDVVSSTWARDSHDLFDFEASQLHRQNFMVQKTTLFYRTGTEVRFLAAGEPVPSGGDPLLKLAQREGGFVIDSPATAAGSKRRLWLVVRDLPSCGHRLAEGDIIKLGRFKFRARQIVATACGGQQPILDFDDGSSCNVEKENAPDLSQTSCRICLLEGSGEDDPLITPCQCRGSIEFVHLGCLRYWIRGRLNLADSPGGSYFFRPLACELCKAVYPTHIHNGKERQPLVEVPYTQPPFIVLENMVRDSQQNVASRGLHVISLAEKVLKLGRGHESDIRIADVSISRFHAKIRFHNGFFLLEDNDSKFGTLVAMKKPRLLEPGCAVSIQMGRTVLTLTATLPGDAYQGLQPGTLHDPLLHMQPAEEGAVPAGDGEPNADQSMYAEC